MAQTIEDVNSRTLLQQFHELYNKQNETETDVENLDTKIDQETIDRQTADLSINSEIQRLKDQIDSLGVLFTYKGEVATIQDLPLTDNVPGDVYYVDSDQSGYIWLEKSGVYQWEQFGPAIDLSEYAKQEDLEQLQDDVDAMNTQVETNASNIVSLTNTKQDKLTAGTNITIDANNVISASGGDKLYMHRITSSEGFSCVLITKDNTTFTKTSLAEWLYNHYFRDLASMYPTSTNYLSSGNTLVFRQGFFGTNNNELKQTQTNITLTTDGSTISANYTHSIGSYNITDVVSEL